MEVGSRWDFKVLFMGIFSLFFFDSSVAFFQFWGGWSFWDGSIFLCSLCYAIWLTANRPYKPEQIVLSDNLRPNWLYFLLLQTLSCDNAWKLAGTPLLIWCFILAPRRNMMSFHSKTNGGWGLCHQLCSDRPKMTQCSNWQPIRVKLYWSGNGWDGLWMKFFTTNSVTGWLFNTTSS